MGLEAEGTVRVGRKTSLGKAHLDGETLVFRGDFKLSIPLEKIRDVIVEGDTLVIKADEEVRFELGAPVAARWMRFIKQPKGLFEKLEVGPTSRPAVVDVTDPLFVMALRERTAGIDEGRVPEGATVIFFGAETREALRKLPLLRARMSDSGALWIVRPKGSKTISEIEVLEAVRESGLVDTKVVALSKTHTGHKCVVPVELRGQMRRRTPIISIPPSAPALGSERNGAAKPAKAKAKMSAAAKKKKKK